VSDPKRFEDWEQVDCNECARYWDSSCDGVSKGSEKPCNSYIATRDIVLPEKIKRLEIRFMWLEWAMIIELVLFILFITLMGGV
jgi:hypothetical protein